MGFLRTAGLRAFGAEIPGGVQILAHECCVELFCILILLLAPAGLSAQVANPAGGTAPTGSPPTGSAPATPPAMPSTQQSMPAQGARANGYAETQKLSPGPAAGNSPHAATDSLRVWEGLQIAAVEFEGVDRSRLEPLPEMLAVQPNQALRAEDVRDSLRRLYATGLYQGISVEGERHGNEVTVIFEGAPQFFLGRVTVEGPKNDRLISQLERATRLTAGTRYDDAKMTRAANLLTDTLQENGYYQATFDRTMTQDSSDAQVSILYHVNLGKQTRVGTVQVTGDPGMTVATFRKKGRLKANSKVTRDTVSRALSDLQKYYEKQQRLEATVALQSKNFQAPTNLLNFNFQANQGSVVAIEVNGVKLSQSKVKTLVPVYEEGTVDDDLLNEGDRRLRDYYQREGYFDCKVTHTRNTEKTAADDRTAIVFDVALGERHEVRSVSLAGNHYFSDAVIDPRLAVHKADLFMPHGHYSQALAQADVNAITALYQSNGFSDVKVTSQVKTLAADGHRKIAGLAVRYEVDEGPQDLIGKYEITGNQEVPLATLKPLLSTEEGQPYSATTIGADRDAILTYYYGHGFDHATVGLTQTPEAGKHLVDATLHITEGEQVFVNRVLVSGLHSTRPSTVEPHLLVKPGQPLDQSKLMEMQRQLYDLTLFNEVNTAVQNPSGDEIRKNVLVQFTEAKRWDLSYGVGFQAQTGNPSTNCPNPVSLIQLGLNPATANCGPNGNTGASALALFDVSRINLWGRDQSITLRTEYGTLEQSATTIYTLPHVFKSKTVDFSLSGGYTNAQDVTTYAASRLEGTVRLTQRPNRPNTLLYQFTYRRVKVNPNSVQVSPDEIPLVSEPVRVGGPGFTWIRDTRRPTPLDAVAGTYTSFEDFVTDNVFDSQANFNRLDVTNSSYYQLGKRHLVLARNTRFGYERAFGEAHDEYIPLPERLYAGGAQSLRGFSINSAGPRDSLTGFPVGGAGVFVNSTELRFPNPDLPYFGNALGFVLFHDMGNAFNNSSDIWPSAIRIKQPHSWTCEGSYLTVAAQQAVTRSSSTNTTGTCDFNDFSHALGLGLRYHTPIGPIRLDFSYDMNPPIYPVVITYGTNSNGSPIEPYRGRASHFNFFFSIGQAF